MTIRLSIAAAVLLAFAEIASPCSAEMTAPIELVRRAEVIVKARVEALSPHPGVNPVATLAGSRTQVQFRIEAVLKGTISVARIAFNGWLESRDERNGGSVPYASARHSGDASCFPMGYRADGVYLLFLARSAHRAYAQPDALTPYWAPLAPANEQVFGPNDAWEAWTRMQVANLRKVRPGI